MRLPDLLRDRLLVVLLLMAAAVAGLAGYTFYDAEGLSYLGDDPKACANCHIMRGHFDDWNRSSHHAVATCNDCHTPEPFVPHWAVKAWDGFKHSFAFTTGFFREPIRITALDRRIAAANCVRCHGDLTARMAVDPRGGEADCVRCHRSPGH